MSNTNTNTTTRASSLLPTLQPPTLADVYAARPLVYAAIARTPLLRHPLLCQSLGIDLYVKHENHLPTGAFKVRGGLNLIGRLTPEERARGVITASTGNHGQSIAFACGRAGVPCTIVVPRGNNPDKNAAMRAWGGTVVEQGRDFDDAREYVESHIDGRRYVHSANEPLLLAGVGTYALEIAEDVPDVDAVLVPIGGGSGACGLVTVYGALGRKTQVIGVQATAADAFARSWRSGTRVVGASAETFAEGVATRVTFDLTFDILSRALTDVVTLDEAELAAGVRLSLETTHNLAEGAGAAAIAGAMKLRDALQGRRVVCVMSGGNLTRETLRRLV
jgi:threonine dehydratase